MAAVFIRETFVLRTERLLGGAEIPEDIHSPIGLPIGAQGPEEIAVSRCAFWGLIHLYKTHSRFLMYVK
jgi:hypothetical protein